MTDKPARTSVTIHEIIANRWSPRAFDPTKPVSRDQLASVLEAARWAPSCFGDEPWRFIIWNQQQNREAWQKAFDCLAPGNQTWAQRAPILILAAACENFRHNGKPNRWAHYDAGAASENICLQATALGLKAHQMGGFDSEKIRSAFNIPPAFTPMAMIALGHPGNPVDLEDGLREKEMADRTRRPLADNFYADGWEGETPAG